MYCFKATSRDVLGNETPGDPVCTTLPIRVKDLVPSASVKSAPGHYFGQYVATKGPIGVFVPSGSLSVKRLALVATKCAECGKVRVRLRSLSTGVLFEKTINLHAAGTSRRRLSG